MRTKIIEKEPLCLPEVNNILSKINKKDFAPVQQKIFDFSKKFSKINKDKCSKLKKDLKDLGIARLSEEHIVQIVDIIPKDLGQLRSIFAGSKTTLTPEQLEQILAAVKKYEK